MDLQNKSCIITGATSGIGKAIAYQLAAIGMTVIICGRNLQKCAETCRDIIKKTGNKKIEYFTFDLASLNSIKIFTEKIRVKFGKIDFLINNAGVWQKERKLSDDGIEMTYSVNHLAPLFLTILLKDVLAASGKASVINLSSSSYKQGKIDISDLEMQKKYSGFKAYANSKLINLLVMKYLSLSFMKAKITVNNIHPGVVFTGIYNDFNPIMRFFFRKFMISPSEGARPLISLIVSGKSEEITGYYFDRFIRKNILSDENDLILGKQLFNASLEYFHRLNFEIKI